jgi:hypothetical protein
VNVELEQKEIEVQQYRNDWALALMSQGIIVKLTIARWRGFSNLTSDKLGLKFCTESSRKATDKYIQLGREKLLPPEIDKQICGIEQQARTNLKAHSFQTVWGYFVPFTAFDEWSAENEKIKQEFFGLSNLIGEQYYTILDTVKEAYSSISHDVWGRLYTDGSIPPASFVSHFVNEIVSKIPSKIDIVSSFKYDTTYFVIPMPSIIEDNLSRARQIERQKEMDDFQSKLEQTAKEKIANEYLKRKQDLIDGFLDSTVANIRKHVAELCDGILMAISNESTKREISKLHKEKIKKTIERVNLLNFYDDNEMKRLLLDLETEVDKFKGERDYDNITLTLQKIVKIGTEEFIPRDFNPSISGLEL